METDFKTAQGKALNGKNILHSLCLESQFFTLGVETNESFPRRMIRYETINNNHKLQQR